VVVVDVVSFTFRFATVAQLRECIAYYETITHPSSRIPAKELADDLGEDWREQRGWEVERWFERLPMDLLEEPKRQKVLKQLQLSRSERPRRSFRKGSEPTTIAKLSAR
jgi:hypothetical protein